MNNSHKGPLTPVDGGRYVPPSNFHIQARESSPTDNLVTLKETDERNDAAQYQETLSLRRH